MSEEEGGVQSFRDQCRVIATPFEVKLTKSSLQSRVVIFEISNHLTFVKINGNELECSMNEMDVIFKMATSPSLMSFLSQGISDFENC